MIDAVGGCKGLRVKEISRPSRLASKRFLRDSSRYLSKRIEGAILSDSAFTRA
jgi:hypothetical protein